MKNKYLIFCAIGLAFLLWIFIPPSFNSLGFFKIHFIKDHFFMKLMMIPFWLLMQSKNIIKNRLAKRIRCFQMTVLFFLLLGNYLKIIYIIKRNKNGFDEALKYANKI